MNEVEYILRIVLKARDELAGALKRRVRNCACSPTLLRATRARSMVSTRRWRRWTRMLATLLTSSASGVLSCRGRLMATQTQRSRSAQLTTEVETSVKTTRKAATTMREYRQSRASEANKEVKALYEAQKRGAVECGLCRSSHQQAWQRARKPLAQVQVQQPRC